MALRVLYKRILLYFMQSYTFDKSITISRMWSILVKCVFAYMLHLVIKGGLGNVGKIRSAISDRSKKPMGRCINSRRLNIAQIWLFDMQPTSSRPAYRSQADKECRCRPEWKSHQLLFTLFNVKIYINITTHCKVNMKRWRTRLT